MKFLDDPGFWIAVVIGFTITLILYCLDTGV